MIVLCIGIVFFSNKNYNFFLWLGCSCCLMERLIWLIEFFMLVDLGFRSCKCFNGLSVVGYDVLVMLGVVCFVG